MGLQPIYQVAEKYELGKAIGEEQGDVEQLLAKPGYAVGQIMAVQGFGVDGMQVALLLLGYRQLEDGRFLRFAMDRAAARRAPNDRNGSRFCGWHFR